MFGCWTVKGGSGTTVFSTAFALALADRHGKATIVDFGGDVPSVLGMAEPAGRGIRDWLSSPGRDAQEFGHLHLNATSRLRVVSAYVLLAVVPLLAGQLTSVTFDPPPLMKGLP